METVTIEAEKAKKTLQLMKEEAERGIENAMTRTAKVAWEYSQVGALEFAQELGILTDAERQRMSKEMLDLMHKATGRDFGS